MGPLRLGGKAVVNVVARDIRFGFRFFPLQASAGLYRSANHYEGWGRRRGRQPGEGNGVDTCKFCGVGEVDVL